MKNLILICFLFITSCQFRFIPSSYYNTAITPPVYTYTPFTPYTYIRPRTYWWTPAPLGNVYNNYYINPRPNPNPRPRTNLPLNYHSGPIGGRRK